MNQKLNVMNKFSCNIQNLGHISILSIYKISIPIDQKVGELLIYFQYVSDKDLI
jgi:hypothetical protein